MGTVRSTTTGRGDLAGTPHYELLQRTLAGAAFQKSARLRDFLLYVCEAALRGKTDDLSEHHIGCAVFGRKPDYSPADDNIVRVHARQLRFRLEEYFRAEGRDEPVIIEIPKGSYVPVFRPRETTAGVERSWRRWIPWACCAALAVALLVQSVRLQSKASDPGVTPSPLLTSMFEPGRTTNVIVPDSGFGTLQSMLSRKLTLEDYLNPGYPESLLGPDTDPRQQRLFRGLATRPYTTYAVLLVTQRLARLAERHNWNLAFRFAKDVRVRDLDTEGNVILLGSAMSNPWVSLYEKDMNFRSGWDEARRVPYFSNVKPESGEPDQYSAADRNGMPGAAYAVVSLATAARSRILILEGVNMEGTEAAVDFVCDAARIPESVSRPLRSASTPFRMEVLLRTRAMAGAARGSEVVAVRAPGAR